jgi:hypothetical protein
MYLQQVLHQQGRGLAPVMWRLSPESDLESVIKIILFIDFTHNK